MKKIIALSIVLLFVAGTACALEIQNSGMMYVRGSWISQPRGYEVLNDAAALSAATTVAEVEAIAEDYDAEVLEEMGFSITYNADGTIASIDDVDYDKMQEFMEDANTYGYLDMELDMTTRLILNDMTKINLQYEIHDENYGGVFQDGSSTASTTDLDDNIEIYRAWFDHEFSTGTIIRAGLMSGAAWSWDFGNNNNGFNRVHVQQKIAPGIIGYVYTKETENGSSNTLVKDANKDDGDQHAIYGVLKFGDTAVQPLFVYWPGSDVIQDRGSDGRTRMLLDVGVGGPLGPVGYEFEFAYNTYSADDGAESNGEDSWTNLGLYLNVWGDVGPAKVGGMIAYGSYDKDSAQGYGFGADFCPTVIGADWMNIGSGGAPFGDTQYYAVTFGQLYASLAISEPLSINGSFAYWMSNEEDTLWEDSTGYELDLGLAYKVSENVTYSIAAGYADVNFDDDTTGDFDPDAVYRIYHKLQLNF